MATILYLIDLEINEQNKTQIRIGWAGQSSFKGFTATVSIQTPPNCSCDISIRNRRSFIGRMRLLTKQIRLIIPLRYSPATFSGKSFHFHWNFEWTTAFVRKTTRKQRIILRIIQFRQFQIKSVLEWKIARQGIGRKSKRRKTASIFKGKYYKSNFYFNGIHSCRSVEYSKNDAKHTVLSWLRQNSRLFSSHIYTLNADFAISRGFSSISL